MAFLPETFDAENVEPSAPIKPVPAGYYTVQIIESDVKEANSGNGMVLSMTFEVLEGAFQGRKMWSSLNILHSNQTAQEIAQRDFSAICRAVGQMQVSDTEALHWKPLRVKVEVELAGTKGKNGYVAKSDRNIIKGYEAVGAPPQPQRQAPPSRQAAPQQQAAAPAARPASMPWKK